MKDCILDTINWLETTKAKPRIKSETSSSDMSISPEHSGGYHEERRVVRRSSPPRGYSGRPPSPKGPRPRSPSPRRRSPMTKKFRSRSRSRSPRRSPRRGSPRRRTSFDKDRRDRRNRYLQPKYDFQIQVQFNKKRASITFILFGPKDCLRFFLKIARPRS